MPKKKSSFSFMSWKNFFIIVICLASLFISVSSIVVLNKYQSSVSKLESTIRQYTENSEETDVDILRTNTYLEFCATIDNKADNAFNQLIAIVGIFASIITLLGVLITFKAPKDIEKDIVNLRELTDKTHALVEEQEYLLLLFNALKEEETAYHKIKQLSKIINDYPNRWQAYLYRGSEYCDKKDYSKAIKDFKNAWRLGCKEETYLNNMSIVISDRYKETKNRIDRDLALQYISKAIKINSEDPVHYINRGAIYLEIKNYELAEKDFDMAMAIDSDNYEAYSAKANLYVEMSQNSSDDEKSKEYIERALECIQKALDLNNEDENLKGLKKLLRDKMINSLTNEFDGEDIIEELASKIDERLGDIAYEEENFIDSISHYTDALEKYNVLSDEMIKDNVDVIERICNKIYGCKEKMSSIDISNSINRKLNLLIIVLGNIGYDFYRKNESEIAGKYFEYATILSGTGTSYSNNLAYMIRRGEYSSDMYDVQALLTCQTPEETSAFLRINRALCMIKGMGYEYNLENVFKEIKLCENELDDALKWWADEETVGAEESNVVLLLLYLMQKVDFDESFDIDSMIDKAISDGFNIPTNIVEIANDILNDGSEPQDDTEDE